jgi:ribosome-associated protein YbcJ (S4-like RNA binding protein)
MLLVNGRADFEKDGLTDYSQTATDAKWACHSDKVGKAAKVEMRRQKQLVGGEHLR